jgi:hypothetical protein
MFYFFVKIIIISCYKFVNPHLSYNIVEKLKNIYILKLRIKMIIE